MSSLRKRCSQMVGLALVAAGMLLVPSVPATAASTGLVITEVFGGGGNTGANLNADFVELYNPTGSGISLAGTSLQYRSSGGTGAANGVAALTGTVPAGKHWLIQTSTAGANGSALPTPDVTVTGVNMAAAAGTVWLANGTTGQTLATGSIVNNANVVDLVGFGSTNTFEGAATPAISVTTSAKRTNESTDGDNNSSDFTAGAQTPENSSAGAPAGLTATDPGNKTGTVGSPITSFDLAATGGTPPYTWSATGLPDGVAVSNSGTVSGTPTTANTYNVTATVTDSAGTPASDDVSFTFTIGAAGPIAIKDIQGTGDASPMVGNTVTTQGVVTASYPTGGLNGFYIQTPGADTPDASDAIFVYGGSGGFATYPSIGDSVDVSGTVAENFGLTELTSASWTPHGSSLGTVTPKTVIPGTDCALPGGSCLSGAALDAAREVSEGEALQPGAGDPWTLTDVYDGGPFYGAGISNSSANHGELGVVAESDKPLTAPTELFDAQNEATDITNRTKWNDAHRIILDDGSSLTYSTTANASSPFPWMTPTYVPRVGAAVTFPAPVILIKDFQAWRVLPTSQVTGAPNQGTQPQLEQTRAAEATPQDVGGDLKLATFNVLNFFPTTGEEYVAAGGGNACTYFTDRAGARTTTNACGNPSTSSGNGPRGAANDANVVRQRDKIVSAINTADADIVSLEELENSAKFGKDRDFAITQLVNALNSASTPGKWAFAPSPTGADLPALADEDVIRTGFIYQPASVRLVGASKILVGSPAFANAREPLAQAFKKVGEPNSSAFAVIVNHFKSKGSGADDGTGQGNANPDRVAQANALVTFADDFKTARGITKVFLAGDFNAYSEEDPIQVLEGAGYTTIDSTTDPDEETYNFDGQIGSLDHVLANAAALPDVAGADVWPINGYESVYYEYSRFNSNVTDLYNSGPFRSSDHSPEIIGINTDAGATTKVNLLNINDFHGRIDSNTTKFATTVEKLRDEQGENHTLFLSAGDNIGASLFASSSQDDNPTIDVLNALDLNASAVGNHEFDRGFSDLTDRVQDRASWTYLGANVYHKGTEDPALPEYDTFDVGGVTVGVIGVVTQETPSLVSPSGVADLDFGDPVEAVNRVAGELSDGNDANGEADVIVAEYHEGAGASLPDSASCADEIASDTVFGKIARTTSAAVDVIFTGHTHKTYACDGPVPGQVGQTRPILQTGEYGGNIGQVVLDVDKTSGDVTSYTQRNVARVAAEDLSYPRVQEVKSITDAALADAAALGNQPVGQISKDITTAFGGGSYGPNGYTGGSRDDRAAESTLGDLVAQALKDGVSQFAEPDLGITNPGGLRAELLYAGDTSSNPANTDGVVTYAEANSVLPFNNTVAIVQLTGAQLKQVLEQQWQTNADGSVPSRPYLQLGLSDNVQVTADPTKAAGSRITSVRIDGQPLDPAHTYTVSTLSFLATGGDNFRAFTQGSFVDTGLLDAQLWRDYLADNSPVAPDFARQQVFERNLPASAKAGDSLDVTLGPDVASPIQPNTGETLNLTSLGSPANTTVEVTAFSGGSSSSLGSFPVTNGTAHIQLTVPSSLTDAGRIEFVAQPSGTTVTIPLQESTPPPTTIDTTTNATAQPMKYGTDGTIQVTVAPSAASGPVTVTENGNPVASGSVTLGSGTVTVAGTALEPGSHTLVVRYGGNSTYNPSQTTVTLQVAKADTSVSATAPAVDAGDDATVSVNVNPNTATGQVTVSEGGSSLGQATLSNGSASVNVGALPAGSHTLTVRYAGDAHHAESSTTVTLQVDKAASTTTADASPNRVVVEKGTAKIAVSVTADGATPTGTVTAVVDGKQIGSGTLSGGATTIKVGPFDSTGTKTIELRYAGNDQVAASSTTTTIRVVKADPSLDVTVRPGTVKVNKTKATVSIRVSADGFRPTGFVTVKAQGQDAIRVRLDKGRAEVTLDKFGQTGRKTITVTYEGDDKTESTSTTETVRVVKG